MRGPCCSVFYHIPFNASSETALYEHFSLYRHYCIHSTVNHSNSSSPFLSPWNTARSSRFSINDWSNQWEHVNTPIHLAFFFSFLYIINALFHKINNNTASCKHISVSLRNTRALNNPSTSGKKKNAESKKPPFCKLCCLPLPFSAYSYTLSACNIYPRHGPLPHRQEDAGLWHLISLFPVGSVLD